LGEDDKGRVQGEQDRRRDWKICRIKMREDTRKEEYRDSMSRTETGRYVEHG
jgi:hypothetical protein